MKKLFYVLAVAALAACNNSGETKEEVKPDTTAAAPAQDTTAPAAPATDTTAKAADTSAAK